MKKFLLILFLSLVLPPFFYAFYMGPLHVEFLLKNIHIKSSGMFLYLELWMLILDGSEYSYKATTELALKGFVFNFVGIGLLAFLLNKIYVRITERNNDN